tara:strand:+ start:445 stop:840 length:396 start_codon:yes stop_codon:yes gene_type:complete
MAATVHTGNNQNFSYTNNTGGNVRVVISLALNNTSVQASTNGIKIRCGPPGSPDILNANSSQNGRFNGIGKNIARQGGSSSSDGVGASASNDVDCMCTEFYLAEGHSIDVQGVSGSYPLKFYNILTIPEGN